MPQDRRSRKSHTLGEQRKKKGQEKDKIVKDKIAKILTLKGENRKRHGLFQNNQWMYYVLKETVCDGSQESPSEEIPEVKKET